MPALVAVVAAQAPQTAAATVEKSDNLTLPKSLHEDISSLKLDGTLTPLAPVFGEKAEFPTFTRELIRLQWRELDPIDVYVIRPRNNAKPQPILYLYSYPSEATRFMDNGYCERITSEGFAAVGFVSALTGQRYHDRPMKEWFVSELRESLVLSVHDVQMMLNYLEGRGDLDMRRVGMFGQGSGGTIAVLAASVDSRIRVLDLLDPWGDWPEWIAQSSLIPETERSTYLTPKFLAGIADVDPVEKLSALKVDGLRLQLVGDDRVEPGAAEARIVEAAPKNALVVRYPTALQMSQVTSGGRIFDWIKEQVKAEKQPPAVGDSQPGPNRSHAGN